MSNIKIIKPHGMSSEKASRVKVRGHKKEYIYASLIGGKVVKGIKKEDVKDSAGKIHTLKGGGEIKGGEGRQGKWQIFLHKLSRFENDKKFYGRDIFIKILKSYPASYEEYARNKKAVKEKIIPHMKLLKKYLSEKHNLSNFLNKSICDERVDFFVIYHDDTFSIFDKQELIEIFTKFLTVENNRTFQKVVLKYDDKIFAEIELRTTNDGKYPSILFNMLKVRAFDLLTKKIKKSKVADPYLHVYGRAIEKFNYNPTISEGKI